MQLSAQIIEPARNLRRQGPETAAQFERPAGAAINYRVSGTPYTDTLAAGMVAVLWGGSTTTVDMTAANYVTFIEPQLGGAATLRIIAEAEWFALWTSQDVVPLDYCWLQGMRYYQPRIALTPSNALQGGATATGIPLAASSDVAYRYATELYCYFKVGSSSVGTDTVLAHLYGTDAHGQAVSLKIGLLAFTNDIAGELNFNGGGLALVNFGSTAAVAGQWYFTTLTLLTLATDSNPVGVPVNAKAIIQTWDQFGTYGRQSRDVGGAALNLEHGTTSATLDLGSNASAEWPDDINYLISDAGVRNEFTDGVLSQYIWQKPTTAHFDGTGCVAAYQFGGPSVGTFSSWPDVSGNGHDLGTTHVVAPSPYPWAGYTIPDQPALTSPSDGGTVGSVGGDDPPVQPSLDWSTSTGIALYDVQMSLDVDMYSDASPDSQGFGRVSYPNIPLGSDPPWTNDSDEWPSPCVVNYWRVAYLSPEGIQGPFSTIFSFTGDIVELPTSVVPADGTTIGTGFYNGWGGTAPPLTSGFMYVTLASSNTVDDCGNLVNVIDAFTVGVGYTFTSTGTYYWTISMYYNFHGARPTTPPRSLIVT